MSGERYMKLFESSIRSQIQYSFWKTGEHWRKNGKIFRRTNLFRVSERDWESTWRLLEDLLSICCAVTQKMFTLTVFALVLNAISVRQSLTTLNVKLPRLNAA